MNRDELEKRNVGENLDTLMNLRSPWLRRVPLSTPGSRKATVSR